MSAIHNYPKGFGKCPNCKKLVDASKLHSCIPPEEEVPPEPLYTIEAALEKIMAHPDLQIQLIDKFGVADVYDKSDIKETLAILQGKKV